MNKITSLIVVALISISLVGCGNSLSNKAVEQGKLAMASHDYDKALSSFEIAINENTKDEEVKEMHDIIKEYKDAKKYIEREDIENTEKALNDVSDQYKKYAIKDDINELKIELENLKTSLAESESEEKEQKETEEVKEQKETKKPEESSNKEKSDKPVDEVKQVAPSRVDEYLMKAGNTQASVSQVYYERGIEEYGDNNHIDEAVLIEAQQISYNKWDNLLNEIWGVLKEQLPKNQMDELRKTQRQWIKDKEARANSNPDEYGKLMSLSYSTEERCYELISGYIK